MSNRILYQGKSGLKHCHTGEWPVAPLLQEALVTFSHAVPTSACLHQTYQTPQPDSQILWEPPFSTVSSLKKKQMQRGFSCFTKQLWSLVMSSLIDHLAAKSLQSCPTLCNPTDGSPPGFPVPGILQARTLEWVAIYFSNAWKWKVKVKSLSRVQL